MRFRQPVEGGRLTAGSCLPSLSDKAIANHRNAITTASAMKGAASASSDTSSEPPSSAVAMTGLPTPPVNTVDFALSSAVTPCVAPAMPPPAMIAVVHFSIGGRSVMHGGRDDRAGDEGRRRGERVEQIVDARNVVGEDLDRAATPSMMRAAACEPGEILAKRKVPAIGRGAHRSASAGTRGIRLPPRARRQGRLRVRIGVGHGVLPYNDRASLREARYIYGDATVFSRQLSLAW